MLNLNSRKVFATLCLFALCLVIGCSGSKGVPESGDSSAAADNSAALQAALAKADAADGTVDKVISKCVTCRLTMDGKPEHSVAYGEYTVQLCSPECEKTFANDPEKALLALKFPEEK
jgi:hypothetical protein